MINRLDNMTDPSRRSFMRSLGVLAGSAAVLSTAPWLASCSADKQAAVTGERARIALIGTGSRGQYHLHNLKLIPHSEVVALCDIHQPHLDEASQLFPEAKTYTDYHALLDDPDIDGVIIATPLGTHARITLDALDAGKHVFCEKAMALTLDECKEVYERYKQCDNVLYYCMQRMYDEKYIRGVQMINDGLIGDVVGMRCHWFRNADWRRDCPDPSLERLINWRLYRETSGGLMTELASHQLEVCSWVTGKMPSKIMGMGDIIHWKHDAREVYDTVNVVYKYSDGRTISYESLISNKYNGMEDQILGSRGTMNLATGLYYLEEDNSRSGIKQLLSSVRESVFSAIPAAGPSWRPETADAYIPHSILDGVTHVNNGQSTIGADHDGSEDILASFCQACITGERAVNVVEEAYSATALCLLGNKAIEEGTTIDFPDEYKIPYMKF